MATHRIEHIKDHLNNKSGDKMATTTQRVFRLIPGVQSYDWGIKGGATSSRVASFASATEELGFKAEDDKPYAELWMGTHPSLPSRVVIDGKQDGEYEALSSLLEKHPELIGDKVVAKFADEKPGCLPFLFKVLSVGKALSIQAHPDKALGKRLHEQRPDVYKDPNHKPEMAIALTPFRGFCGFRPLREIVHFIKSVPEFAQLVKITPEELDRATSLSDEREIKAMLKKIFANLMNSPPSLYEPLAAQLSERFSAKDTVEGVQEVEQNLVLKLAEEFPRDVGIFCTFLLNISTLNPGEALFLQANEPHAYLEGEILECMASSDNVVRAGLTPKLRDTETLIEMCTYQSGSDRGRLQGVQWGKSSPKQEVEALLYDPPIEEFSVVTTRMGKATAKVCNQAVDGPSILLVLQGEVEVLEDGQGEEEKAGVGLKMGQLAFIAAGTKIEIKNVGEGEVGLARAFVEA
ncbi:probable PMI40 - mannose-6-phosphate isomerase [Ustilago trichophora]|uniref:Mannose-6-phosphate isomerase n=1 Tax=Ustilago trichophora TaxID=86804 RepID=A0A5C3ENM6_9BASI|nr:probable PMI40 - mannose-6-phosphate isomerase [Ustilago trichophora]